MQNGPHRLQEPKTHSKDTDGKRQRPYHGAHKAWPPAKHELIKASYALPPHQTYGAECDEDDGGERDGQPALDPDAREEELKRRVNLHSQSTLIPGPSPSSWWRSSGPGRTAYRRPAATTRALVPSHRRTLYGHRARVIGQGSRQAVKQGLVHELGGDLH